MYRGQFKPLAQYWSVRQAAQPLLYSRGVTPENRES